MADAEQSKLYLSSEQYNSILSKLGDKPEHLRLGQWLVNLYGEPGQAYPHIFYFDDPKDVWSHVEVLTKEDQ
jgi:hypothetical protein